MVQDLAWIVEYGFIGAFHDIFGETLGEEFNPLLDGETLGGEFHNLFQRKAFVSTAGKQFVEVVDVGLQVLAMVEFERLGADHWCQSVFGVREVDECEHIIKF